MAKSARMTREQINRGFLAIGSPDVEKAISEFHRMKRDAFLRKIGSRMPSKSWFVRGCDAKSIAARAFHIATGRRIHTTDFNTRDVVRYFGDQGLGYKLSPSRDLTRAAHLRIDEFDPSKLKDERKRIKKELVQREGQPSFRKKLLRTYGKCAVTKVHLEHVLHAAHIIQHLGPATNKIQNGMILRADIHALYDKGLIAIDDGYVVRVHRSLSGTPYWRYHGRSIHLPEMVSHRPDRIALAQKYKLRLKG
jgi:HNH endonuclease